jgi:hypothetical protein
MKALLALVCALAAGCGSVSSIEDRGDGGVLPDGGSPSADAGGEPDLDASSDELGPPHTVFVTSAEVSAGLGGVQGADDLCRRFGEEAGLEGRYRAILVDSSTTLAERLEVLGPVENLLGETLAETPEAFFAGDLLAPNSVTENSEALPDAAVAWIGSSNLNCNDWSVTADDINGGLTFVTNTGWTQQEANTSCVANVRLQCISEPAE